MNKNGAKSVISLLLALCMLMTLLPPAFAAEPLSGKCGGDAAWNLTADGTLTISGQGELTTGNWIEDNRSWPWHKYREAVKTIEVKDGITSIGCEAFSGCVNVTRISLPTSMRTIKKKGFYGCSGLREVSIPRGVTEIGEMGFCACTYLERIYLPVSIQTIGRVAFDYSILQDVYYGGTKAQWDQVSKYASDCWHKRDVLHENALALPPADAEAKPAQSTDWHFLMAIFKNTKATATVDGQTYTVKQSLTDAEVQRLPQVIDMFKKTLEGTGLVTLHIDTVVIDAPITKLENSDHGLYPSAGGVFTLLKNKGIDLSKYDYVTALGTLSRDVPHTFNGITHMVPFADSPGWSFVEANNHGKPMKDWNLDKCEDMAAIILHELLHSMEYLSGYAFDLHGVEKDFSAYGIQKVNLAVDIQLVRDRIKSSHGSGVPAGTWTLPRSQVVKTEDLSIPEGTASITGELYRDLTNLKSVRLPGTVKKIEYGAFRGCKNLKTVSIPAGVTEIACAAFYETGVTDVYYGGTEAQWKAITFTRDSSGRDFNDQLKNAEIHFGSEMPLP